MQSWATFPIASARWSGPCRHRGSARLLTLAGPWRRRHERQSGTWRGNVAVVSEVRGQGPGLGVPDVAAVVADCPVGGEETRARRVQDRHPGPPVFIGPGRPDGLVVAVDVGPVVG